MSKRRLILISLALASVLGLLVWQTSGPPEPVFEGRPLTSWLDHHVSTSAAIPPYNSPGWMKADEALRAIGTNAIPTLLKMIQAKDPPPAALKLLAMAQRCGLTRISYRYAAPRHEEAEYAFRMLGTNAASAVPELTRIYEANVSPSSQMYAALSLGNIGRAAQAALPALIRTITHTNREVRFYAVSAIANIGGDPDTVFPALTTALKDSYVSTRWNALGGLSQYGARARPVVPEILKMINDEGRSGGGTPIKKQVEITLWRVAPEKVGKPLVVEESTPIIANGITAEALKVMYYGKHQTLIPPGKSVPVLAQYWNSDPRPRLTLYRGANGSEEKDHFLGHFEVLGLPASDNLNVSTLCVIADGQIFLCARDNTQERFLEIRRIANEPVQ